MAASIYCQRRNALEEEREWHLEPDALSWRFLGKKGGEGRIDFSDILRIQMSYEPNRIQADRYILRGDSNRGRFEIGNVNYRGLGDLEARTEAFREFVDCFLDALRESGEGAGLRVGTSPLAYLMSCLITFGVIAVLLGAGVFFLAVGMLWIAAVNALIILFYMPRLFRYLKRNKPRTLSEMRVPWNELGMRD